VHIYLDLPAVVALGASRDEVNDRIREALAAYTEDLQERGETLPAHSSLSIDPAATRCCDGTLRRP
jgi:predicted RNase H-like HicB family nuclease